MQKVIDKSIKSIQINKRTLNKYKSAKELLTNEIEKSSNNFNGKIKINKKLKEIKNINIYELSLTELKKKAIEIFSKYNYTNVFENDNNLIIVNNEDIRESIKKIIGDKRQKEYLEEHLKIFSILGEVIKQGKLVSESFEQKSRENYNSWHYYVVDIIIDNSRFLFEFDVVSRNDGENHYRVQRLVKL